MLSILFGSLSEKREVMKISKITIGIDIDETINSQITEILKLYNKKYKDNLSIDNITDYNIHKFVKPECKNIFKEFCNDKFFKSLIMTQETIEALTELNNNYKIYFVTSAHPKTLKVRDKWLSKYLSWYTTKQLIVCRKKSLLNLNYLVDDCYDNLIHGTYRKILITKKWNENITDNELDIEDVYRVDSISEVPKLLEFVNSDYITFNVVTGSTNNEIKRYEKEVNSNS